MSGVECLNGDLEDEIAPSSLGILTSGAERLVTASSLDMIIYMYLQYR